jgi:hypothetical protein
VRGLRRALEARAKRLPGTGKDRVIPGGGTACSICRDGLCNASIRNVPLAAIGCGQPTPGESSAAIAALRSATFRRRSAHACGCVPARWGIIVHRAARQGGTGSLHEQVSGPLVPVTPGRAVPALAPESSTKKLRSELHSCVPARNPGTANPDFSPRKPRSGAADRSPAPWCWERVPPEGATQVVCFTA